MAMTELVTARQLVVRALGIPAKQGSKKLIGRRLVEADTKLPDWRKQVIAAAHNAMLASSWVTLTGPCELSAMVWLPRPKTVTRAYPIGMQDGDLDKYLRAIGDALKLAGVIADDKLITDYGAVRKRYADDVPCGARIVVRAVEETLL